MMLHLKLFLFIFLFNFIQIKCKKLIFAHAIWRHGSRSPLSIYPSSPYQEDFWTPGHDGELIAQGMDEHVKLARKFRQRYVVEEKLVSSRYKADEIYVRSSDKNRTIISAMSHMAGFYFGAGIPGVDYPYNWAWPALWTPIPIHTVSWDQDTLLNFKACRRSVDLFELAKQTPEFQQFVKISEPTIEFLSNHSGKNVTNNIKAAFLICDTIVMEDIDMLPQTPWQKQIIPACKEMIVEYFNFWYGFNTLPYKGHNFRIELPQSVGGKLFFEILTRMQQKYENYLDNSKHSWITNLKYYVYSAHDTVLGVFAALFDFHYVDCDRNVNPKPSNAYTIELWIDDNSEPIVKVLYWRKDEPSYVDVSKQVSGCKFTQEGCNLDHFIARSLKYKPPDNFEEFCNSPIPELTPN